MRARRSRAVSLLVTSVVLTAFLIPGAIAQSEDADPAPGPETAAPAAADRAVVDLAQLPAEPPVRPPPPPPPALVGAPSDHAKGGGQGVA
ncbi:hypothetical protein [Streptomyces sp. NPDC059411]|uniref:hypothetical protein n=1 Tax=Streptomyces sp. NPDC059411 TaxID=3346825 RepID=UPI0036A7D05B